VSLLALVCQKTPVANCSPSGEAYDLIEQIRRDYNNPGLRVDLVAHSMGGLVTRYYLRYGRVDVLDDNEFPVNHHGVSRVRKVILLGTPNLGSVSTIQEFLQGFKVGFARVPTETMATLPSVYQLFPHPIRTWLVLPDGRELERDLFDTKIWRDFEWSIFDPEVRQRILKRFKDPAEGAAYLALLERYFEKHIERARRFVWSLSVPMESSPVRYIVFGGDCELTPARVLVEEDNGDSVLRLLPRAVKNRVDGVDYTKLMLEPGDGRVTKHSLFAREALDPSVPRHKYSFFPLDHSILLCESHDRLTGNVSFQNNLLNILLTREQALPIKEFMPGK
jgi:pimeloyl-ACP methyl ester carboxylesterase